MYCPRDESGRLLVALSLIIPRQARSRNGSGMTSGKTGSHKNNHVPRIRDRNRRRILDAAIEIFARRGFDGASIAEIADQATLPKANVYYYFESKEKIYSTIIDDLIAEWDAALDHIDPARDPADALTGYILAKLELSYRRPAHSKMFANEIVHGGRFLSRANRSHMREITLEKGKIFRAWARAGKMDPLDPLHLFILLWGSTQFYADFDAMVETMLDGRRLNRAEFKIAAATIVHIVLKGCGVRGATAATDAAADLQSPANRRADRTQAPLDPIARPRRLPRRRAAP
jgi:TetR/AcrR family transcriptional regulator